MELDGPSIVVDGLVESSLNDKCVAQLVVGTGMVRLDLDRLVIEANRMIKIAHFSAASPSKKSGSPSSPNNGWAFSARGSVSSNFPAQRKILSRSRRAIPWAHGSIRLSICWATESTVAALQPLASWTMFCRDSVLTNSNTSSL